MKFVKGISLFFAIPLLTLLTLAVGFGAGVLYGQEGTEEVPAPLQPKPLVVSSEAEKQVSEGLRLSDCSPENGEQPGRLSEMLSEEQGQASTLPTEMSPEALQVDATGNILTEYEESEEAFTASADSPKGFYLVIYDNRVVVLEENRETVYLETDIGVEGLTEEARLLLISGLWVQNEEELYSYLETFSS